MNFHEKSFATREFKIYPRLEFDLSVPGPSVPDSLVPVSPEAPEPGPRFAGSGSASFPVSPEAGAAPREKTSTIARLLISAAPRNTLCASSAAAGKKRYQRFLRHKFSAFSAEAIFSDLRLVPERIPGSAKH